MQQAWHIFKKDVRYLRLEIALLLTLAGIIYWFGTVGLPHGDLSDGLFLFFAAAAAYAVARTIHAEAIPGENQFWITRPYRWQSLLMAKLLFVLVFINLPVFAAQAAVVIVGNFPVAVFLPGLLWMQFLLLFCVTLPLTVMASLTDNLPAFVGCLLAFGLVAFGVFFIGIGIRRGTPSALEWLPDTIGFIALAALAPPVLYLQYKSRRTNFSRALTACIAIGGTIVWLAVPWRALFPFQSRMSKQTFDVQMVQRATSRLELEKFGLWIGQDGQLQFNLPVELRGLPQDVEPQIEAYGATLDAPDGKSLQFNNTSLAKARVNTMSGLVVEELKWNLRGTRWPPARRFFSDERGRSLTLHATFYFTLFGNPREQTFTLHKNPTNVLDGLQCFGGYFNQLVCRSAFRWPARLVSQKSGTGKTTMTRLISYSPFPATLDLDPIFNAGTAYYARDPLPEERPVTLEVAEPLAYIRREVEVRDLHLDLK